VIIEKENNRKYNALFMDYQGINAEPSNTNNRQIKYARKAYYPPTIFMFAESSNQIEGGDVSNQNENTSGMFFGS